MLATNEKLKKLFMAILLYPQSFCLKTADRRSPKRRFYFVLFEKYKPVFEPRALAYKPTQCGIFTFIVRVAGGKFLYKILVLLKSFSYHKFCVYRGVKGTLA